MIPVALTQELLCGAQSFSQYSENALSTRDVSWSFPCEFPKDISELPSSRLGPEEGPMGFLSAKTHFALICLTTFWLKRDSIMLYSVCQLNDK